MGKRKINKEIKISFETMWFEVRTSLVAELLIAIIMLHFAYITRCWYLTLSASYLLILTILRGVVLAGTIRDKNQLRKYYQSVITSFFTMILSAGYVAMSVVMFYQPDMPIGYRKASLMAILAFVQLFIAIHDVAFTWKKKQIQIHTYCFMTVAFISVSLTMGIDGILSAVWKVDIASLQGMTGLICGTMACVHGAMIWWSNLMTKENHRKKYEELEENGLAIFSWLSSKRTFIFVGTKIVLAVLSMSSFMLVHVLYSLAMAMAEKIALKNENAEYQKQTRGFIQIGIILFWSGVGYIIYATWMLIYGKSPTFSVALAVAIIIYTVIEFSWTMRAIMKARRRGDLFGQEVLGLSLASVMICLVLNVTAFMATSFVGDPSFYNGLIGVLFGGFASLIGLCMILYGKRIIDR